MSTAIRPLSAEDLFCLPEGQSQWCELVEGEIVHMSPPGAIHGRVAMRLTALLDAHVMRHGLGAVFATETGFIVARNPDTVLAPDGAFVRQSRLDAIGTPKTYFPEAPALVVEVISPSDTVSDVAAKMRRWIKAGVELAWAVDPWRRAVTVYRGVNDIGVMTDTDTLRGEHVVPGFECKVADIFAGL